MSRIFHTSLEPRSRRGDYRSSDSPEARPEPLKAEPATTDTKAYLQTTHLATFDPNSPRTMVVQPVGHRCLDHLLLAALLLMREKDEYVARQEDDQCNVNTGLGGLDARRRLYGTHESTMTAYLCAFPSHLVRLRLASLRCAHVVRMLCRRAPDCC
ncbi:hypothetical protein C8Q80DRAFT_32555 [Daedaleopsis nitida]|nr:hypothetical protein C8Q80DRAFT_32555 [Daedaleopsis nitida]